MTGVLLVEDDANMRNLLKTLLEIEGFQVTLAGDSRESIIQAIHDQDPQAILMDVHLKKVSGLDILRQVRLDQSLDHLKIMVTSGQDLKEQCLSAGANQFLLKPFMPDELIKWLRNVVYGS